MKDKKQTERSMVARYRQAFKHAGDIAALIDGNGPTTMSIGEMQRLRDLTNDLSQCVHEFNAYRNVVMT
jgi:hypothetical protein